MSGQQPRKSILIVDDDVQFATSLQKILSRAGHDISLADNSLAALCLLSASSFDVVITDYRVGSLSGLDMISSIRRQGIPVRILLLTAFGNEDVATNAKKAGADAYLSKPVKRDTIVECVSRLLSSDPGGTH